MLPGVRRSSVPLARLGLVLLLAPTLSSACRSSAPAAAPPPAPAADVPRLSIAYPASSTCAPLEAGRAYDAELYAFARRADELAAEIGRSGKEAGPGAARAEAAERAFDARREELAGGWRAICGALPDRVSEPSRELLRAKLSGAIYRVCTALPSGVEDEGAKARLARVCEGFKGAIGQP